MCGIAGYLSNKSLPQHRVDNCLKSMHSRGPDGQGVFKDSNNNHNVGLLHTRLSILDLEIRSAQPFHLGPYVFSYNGELYNYLELKRELEALGYQFHTTGDTEVLATAWIEWGKNALNKFDGMWAFSVYDKNSKILTLATDPFGEKPLYLYRNSKREIYFGSQIDSVLMLAGEKPRPNWQHLKRYLVNGYKSLHKTNESFIDGVVRIPGNQIIEIKNREMATSNYWSKPNYTPNFLAKRQELVENVREALIRSVKRRMRSDVPLAFCMSGGVDSNSIIGIAASHLGLDVRGFTILNKDGRYNERELVDFSSAELGIKNEQIMLSADNFIPNLTKMILKRHGPVSTLSYYTQNYLHKAISENGYKVAISGTGADELFSGYYDHHLLYLGSQFSNQKLRKTAVQNWETHVKPIIRNPALQDPEMYLKQPMFREHIYYRKNVYSQFLLESWDEAFSEVTYCGSLMRNRMMNELYHEAVPVILTEDDYNAMTFSIENRSPFLSRELLEVSLNIPDQELVRDGYAKSILREAMRGLVPDKILWERKKVGFNSSLFEVADLKSDTLRELILDKSPFYDVVNRRCVETFLKKDLELNSDSKFLFNLINAKITIDFLEC